MALDKWMRLYPVLLLFVFNAGYTEAQNSTSTSKTTPKATTTASKPTTKTTTASTTRATTKTPTTTPKSSPSTAKATTKISTVTATTKPVTTEETPCECRPKQPDDVPFIVVTTFLTICLLGYVALAAYLIYQRYRKSPLENDARNVEGTNTNDYTTTPNASGIFYENVTIQNHRPGNSERSSQDDSNLYQHLSPIDRPTTIYETVLTHKNNADIVGDFR